jgi:hypothetical protein
MHIIARGDGVTLLYDMSLCRKAERNADGGPEYHRGILALHDDDMNRLHTFTRISRGRRKKTYIRWVNQLQ